MEHDPEHEMPDLFSPLERALLDLCDDGPERVGESDQEPSDAWYEERLEAQDDDIF